MRNTRSVINASVTAIFTATAAAFSNNNPSQLFSIIPKTCPDPPTTYQIQRAVGPLFNGNNNNSPWSDFTNSIQNAWSSLTTGDKANDISSSTAENNDVDSVRRSDYGNDGDGTETVRGVVVRCAARPNMAEASTNPSSKSYTTRKSSMPLVHVTPTGVTGDYNHYRTVALESTGDRALSILTTDVLDSLSSSSLFDGVREGDLGENILVAGLTQTSLRVGDRFRLGKALLVEITERIVPCPNLCKLKFIDRTDLAPKDKVRRCVDFMNELDTPDGRRGWYAKVLGEGGIVRVGDEVVPAAA